MIFTQGALGYGLTSVMGAVVLEIFQGKQYGSIFGTIMLAALAGGAAGPWATGLLYDLSGSYTLGLCDRHRRQHPVGDRDLAGVAAQGARGRRADAQGAGAARRAVSCVMIATFSGRCRFPSLAADRRWRAESCRPAWSPDRSGGADESRPPAPARSRRSMPGSRWSVPAAVLRRGLDDVGDQLAPGAQPLGEFGPALFGARHEQDHLHVQKGRAAERILLAAVHGLQRVDEIRKVLVPGRADRECAGSIARRDPRAWR